MKARTHIYIHLDDTRATVSRTSSQFNLITEPERERGKRRENLENLEENLCHVALHAINLFSLACSTSSLPAMRRHIFKPCLKLQRNRFKWFWLLQASFLYECDWPNELARRLELLAN